MKTNQLFFAVFLSISFILNSFTIKASPIPTGMLVAESIASGNWSNPAIWSNGLVPQDSTFVTIRSGHTVTLTENSACHGLVIDSNAILDNGIYELRIQLREFMHGIQWDNFDDGIPYGLSGNAPPIDATWDINNPNNVNWSIYMVNGTHAGTGDIKISFYDVYNGGASQPNSSPITITGNGAITNTGTLFIADNPGGNQGVIKFNSACNLSFYCDITIYSPSVSFGLKTDNYGNVHLKGNANLIMGGMQGTFKNKPGSSLIIDNGFLQVCDFSQNIGYFLNEGNVDVLNGDVYIPSFSMIDNRNTVNINGNILGLNATSDQSNFTNNAVGAVLSITGEIFPPTNKGTLSTTQGAVRPNYVIYKGVNQNVVVPKGPFATSTVAQAYSVVVFENNGVKTLLGDIGVDDSLIIKDNAIFTTSTNSYAIEMNRASVWKNTSLDSDPFLENNGLVSFIGDSSLTQHILCDVTGGETFYDLTVNNSGAGVLLNLTDVNVTDTLRLEDGILTTNNNKIYLTNPTAGSLAAFSDTSFVNGNFRRSITSNTANYSFPVGYDTLATTYYRADLVNNNLVGITYIDAKVDSITETGNNVDIRISTLQDNDSIIDIKSTAIWSLTPNSQPTGGSYGINLYTQNIMGLTDNLFFTVKRAKASNDYADWNTFSSTTTVPALGASGRTLASGYAKRSGLTSFSEFAVGIINSLTTGIDKENLINTIRIYPNPAIEKITIDLGNLSAKNITIELRDILGNQVSKGTLLGDNQFQITRNNIASGMYLLNVIVDQERYTKKILFQ